MIRLRRESRLLWAHVLTSRLASLISRAIVFGVALVIGFRREAGVPEWLAVSGTLVRLTLVVTCIAAIAGAVRHGARTSLAGRVAGNRQPVRPPLGAP